MSIEPTLYTDPQTAAPVYTCEICGGTCYPPGYHCLRCERSRL